MTDPVRLLFAGRKRAGRDALAWSLEAGFDIVGVMTDAHLPGSQCAEFATANGLPLLTLEEAEQGVVSGDLVFDLGVSFVYWRIFKEPLLSHPGRGFINFHPAPLPDLKGVGGYNVALLERRDRYGVSAHYIDAGVDTGPIIEVQAINMNPAIDTAASLGDRSMQALGEQYRRVVAAASDCDHRLPTTENRDGRHITRAMMEGMKEIGPDDDAQAKARAFWFPPYGGAWLHHGGARHTVVPDTVLESMASDTHLRDIDRGS